MTQPRRNIELLLLGVGSATDPRDNGIGGITRFQKLLFLLAKEGNIPEAARAFDFMPYKAGPYSSKLYDDLELLENLALVVSEATAEASEPETAELELLRFEELMGDSAQISAGQMMDESGGADAYEERKFRLTEKGKRHVEELVRDDKYAGVVDAIKTIKSRYAHYSLNDLLYHVYTKYPEMATESEIKDKVLRRRR